MNLLFCISTLHAKFLYYNVECLLAKLVDIFDIWCVARRKSRGQISAISKLSTGFLLCAYSERTVRIVLLVEAFFNLFNISIPYFVKNGYCKRTVDHVELINPAIEGLP